MIVRLLVVSLYISLVQNALGSNPNCKQLIVFGNSLTDDGAEAQGESHGFTRFSNGPVWPEYLNTMLQTCDQYINYAYSGAKSDLNNYYFNGWSGVLWQIETYLNSTPIIPPDTLIILELGGGNDMFDGDNKTVEVALNAMRAVRRLAGNGARKVVALNLVDLSTVPGIPENQRAWISELISETNTRLKETLGSPTDPIHSFPSFNLKLFDLKEAMNKALASFSNTAQPYTHHRNNTQPGDIKNYAFFDEYHPSTFVHFKIAQAIYESLQIEPNASSLICANLMLILLLYCLMQFHM